MERENLLSVKDVVVEYRTMDGVVHAVNGVSFDLKPGETFGLVGETGAGKTTIAKTILRILPSPPAEIVSGQVLFGGKDLLGLDEKEMTRLRGNSISMIFQDPMTALNPVFTVGDQIAESIQLHRKCKRGEAELAAMKMLETVGIPGERFGDYPHQFSGGMKQRVVIAIALACTPALLLADEPTTALDVTIQAQVLDLMAKLKAEFNTSMIMITHDLGIVAKSCDRVGIMYAGSIVEMGSKYQVFAETRHPYTQGLFDSLPDLERRARRLTPIPGLMPNPMDLPPGCPFHPRCPNAKPDCSAAAPEAAELEQGHWVRCHNPNPNPRRSARP